MGVTKSVSSIGMAARKRRVTIGGSKKDPIYVLGLKSGEFVVVQENDKVILQTKEGAPKATFGPNQGTVSTSSAEVTLKISLDQTKLNCQ